MKHTGMGPRQWKCEMVDRVDVTKTTQPVAILEREAAAAEDAAGSKRHKSTHSTASSSRTQLPATRVITRDMLNSAPTGLLELIESPLAPRHSVGQSPARSEPYPRFADPAQANTEVQERASWMGAELQNMVGIERADAILARMRSVPYPELPVGYQRLQAYLADSRRRELFQLEFERDDVIYRASYEAVRLRSTAYPHGAIEMTVRVPIDGYALVTNHPDFGATTSLVGHYKGTGFCAAVDPASVVARMPAVNAYAQEFLGDLYETRTAQAIYSPKCQRVELEFRALPEHHEAVILRFHFETGLPSWSTDCRAAFKKSRDSVAAGGKEKKL